MGLEVGISDCGNGVDDATDREFIWKAIWRICGGENMMDLFKV